MIIIALGLAVILAVIAFNMYQESQYRKQVREQFGHSNKDALLTSKTQHVRDGQVGTNGQGKLNPKLSKAQKAALRNLQEQDEIFAKKVSQTNKAAEPKMGLHMEDNFGQQTTATEAENSITSQTHEPLTENAVAPQNPNLTLEELAAVELPWFDTRFDYLAYIVLDQAQELHALPRLSNRHRFQIIGCTMDDRFQVAEPIPGVFYQGFVMGLQAVSRNGLAAREELQQFNQQVESFAQLIGGKTRLTNLDSFMEVAQALDDLCARVDQTIAIHLVSHTSISGTELRSAVENSGFTLGEDGIFHYPSEQTDSMFSLTSLDNTPFTNALLDNQAYRGFSMLFDIPHVQPGEKVFDRFMNLAVQLSGQLSLELVNDKMEEVSTQWLKDVCVYVLARQEEMQKVGIRAGSKVALRLFS